MFIVLYKKSFYFLTLKPSLMVALILAVIKLFFSLRFHFLKVLLYIMMLRNQRDVLFLLILQNKLLKLDQNLNLNNYYQ